MPSPRERPDRRLVEGVVALVGVQALFGLFPLAIKVTTDPDAGGFSPRAVVAWRIAWGAGVLFALACLRHGRRALVPRAELPRLALLGFLGIVFNQVLATEGVHRTQVTKAGLLMCLIPVFTYGLALALRHERFRPARAAGLGLAFLGALLLVGSNAESAALRARELLGDLMIVGNTFSYALFLVLAKPLLARRPVLVVLAWIYVMSLWSLPLIAHGEILVPRHASPSVWWGMGFTVVFLTVVAYLMNTFALARVSASTTAAFIYLQPLVAGAAGYLVRGERLGARALVAALFLLVGLFLVTRPGPRASPLPAPEG